MRFFERILLFAELGFLAAAGAGLGWSHGTGRLWAMSLEVAAMVAALMFLAHLVLEDFRWQMLPSYSALLAIGVFAAQVAAASSGRPAGSVSVLVAATMLCVMSLGLASILPVFTLPKPSGAHAIGSTMRRWSNPTSDGRSAARLLNIQFWYPTEAEQGRLVPYRRSESWSPKSAQLALVTTHARAEAPLAPLPEGWPVILFSPAWNGRASQNTVQFEMLASQGYVVAAIDHPAPASDIPVDFDLASEEKMGKYAVEVRRRAGDVEFVLDRLAQINDKDPAFAGRLDLSAVGIFGHSFGGAVAAEACWLDMRIRAGINMDGLMFGESADAGIEQPFFFMSDDTATPSLEELQSPDKGRRMQAHAIAQDMERIERSLARYGGYFLSAEGLAHNDFCDRPLYSPLRRLTGAGGMKRGQAMKLVNGYMLAYFDWSLKGYPEAWWERPVSAEVRFRSHTAATAEYELV